MVRGSERSHRGLSVAQQLCLAAALILSIRCGIAAEGDSDEASGESRERTQTHLVGRPRRGVYASGYVGRKRRRRRELLTTDTDESAMAADASIGSKSIPKAG